VTGPGDLARTGSGAGNKMPLLAKEGYADLFCLTEASSVEVSTRKEPVGGRVNWNPLAESIGVARLFGSWPRFAEIRARIDTLTSLGSLLVLSERARPSGRCCCRGALSVAGVPLLAVAAVAPDVGSSVCMKQHLLPYGHDPDTQNVWGWCVSDYNHGKRTNELTLQISVLY
jgi:hypothetical protein